MSKPAPRTASREPLTRAAILAAALALVDRDGPGALTMRNVGRRLGVEAMSLYHHVANREELLDGLAETMVRSGLSAPRRRVGPGAALTRFARDIRATARAHPGAFHLVGLRPLRTPAAGAAIAALLSELSAAGLSSEQAVTAYRAVAAYARGFALSEIAGLTYGPGTDTPIPAGLEEYATALQQDTDTTFEAGLAAIIDGLLARAAPSDAGPATT